MIILNNELIGRNMLCRVSLVMELETHIAYGTLTSSNSCFHISGCAQVVNCWTRYFQGMYIDSRSFKFQLLLIIATYYLTVRDDKISMSSLVIVGIITTYLIVGHLLSIALLLSDSALYRGEDFNAVIHLLIIGIVTTY